MNNITELDKRMLNMIKEDSECGIRSLKSSDDLFKIALAILCFKRILTLIELYEKEGEKD